MTNEHEEAAPPAGPPDPTVQPRYPTKCLGCGAELAIVAYPDPQTPPWACQPCGRAFWPAELQAAMTWPDLYDPTAGWPSDTRTLHVLDQAAGDQQAAEIRGTSLLVEQLHMVADDVLNFWRKQRGVTTAFLAEIDAHLAFRHYKPPTPNPPPKPPKKTTKRKA